MTNLDSDIERQMLRLLALDFGTENWRRGERVFADRVVTGEQRLQIVQVGSLSVDPGHRQPAV
jgi:hypothetical protein